MAKRASRLWIAASLSLAVVLACVSLMFGRHNYAGDLESCLKQNNCRGIRFLNGKDEIDPANVETILRLPVFAGAADAISQIRPYGSPAPDNVYLIVADVGNGPQAFTVTAITSPEGYRFDVSRLIVQLLSITEQKGQPGMKTMGDLYKAMAEKAPQIVEPLKANGVSKIDIATSRIPVDELPSALHTLAENNHDVPLRIMRP